MNKSQLNKSQLNENQLNQHQSTKAPGFNRLRWIVFSLFAIPLLGVILKTHLDAARLERNLAVVNSESGEARLEMLSAEERKVAFLEKQKTAKIHRLQLAQIYRSCRTIDDVAANPSALIVFHAASQPETNDTLLFSVPEGEHVFLFQLTKIDDATSETVEVKKREFPIKGPGGFRVALRRTVEKEAKASESRRLILQIESNRDSFQTVSEDLLEASNIYVSSSGSGSGITLPVAFPNQVNFYPETDGEGVLLNSMNWSVKEGKKRYKLKFDMRLLTDGPKVIPATQFSRYAKGKFTYAGNGKYIVEQEGDPSEN